MEYLDFETSSESGDEDGMICELDSDEEERQENRGLLRMLNLQDPPSKSQRNIQDFEAEMEAELDRRAFEVEVKGGMEHQKSLSRSSSNTSLHKSPRASPIPGTSSEKPITLKKSSLKRQKSTDPESEQRKVKCVKFSDNNTPEVAPGRVSDSAEETNPQTEASTSLKKVDEKQYDKLYFDSDESDDEDKTCSDKKRFMTDDELFYDPSADEKDQAWIDQKRRKSYGESNPLPAVPVENPGSAPSSSQHTSSTTTALPSTDAILNCPACFTTVCHDCQRHELYVGQYRAMFVRNCLINKQETLRIPEKKNVKRNKKNKATDSSVGFINDSGSDVFYPVSCKICKTQVAMYDSEEIYHFFNVLASQP